ncbi:MAG: outer membrane protein transport protein [Bacteriovorax sp.]|jgi:long-subunit fatty acid transport protein
MKKIFLLMIFLSTAASASYPEFFGASFSTTSIGNQANLDENDPSNNYYVPASLGFSDKVNILMQASSTSTHFKRMSNITVTNNTNSTTAPTTGNVENNYQAFQGGALHFALPIGYQHVGTLGLSVFLPLGHLMETNSGSPFLPEYVMYHSRYRRTSVYLNFARKWSDDLSWSLGTIVGFQASADVKTNLSLNGAAYGSWGQARSKISPSLGLIASIVKKIDNKNIYFTYQQEMKSNLHALVSGEINNPGLALFESGIDSMIFYDPHTFRVGASHNFGTREIFAAFEYQLWSGYKPPTINITKTGGVIVGSSNYERIKIRDTFNPRIGMNFQLTDRWSTGLGLGYRMTPLDGDFSGAGNSIDSDTYILSTGLQYRIVIWSKDVNLGTSLEYQQLQKKHVTKTTGQEEGSAGPKIGAGGYDIDGYILAAAFGIKFNF